MDMASCQDIYFLQSTLAEYGLNLSILMKYDAQTCELQEVYDFTGELNSPISPWSLSFHPDGRLYMIANTKLLTFNTLNGKVDKIESETLKGSPYLAISEEGQVLITEFIGDGFSYIDYDLRKNQRIKTYSPQDFFGISNLSIPIGGFLNNNDLLFFGVTEFADNQYIWGENTYAYWDMNAGKYDTTQLHNSREFLFLTPSIYLPPCEPRQMLSTGSYNDLRNNELIHIYTEDRTITTICPGQLFPKLSLPTSAWAVNGVANTTDFRQSPLRIDLDANNSSLHPTAGYYDTLTTCHQEAPVTDDDIMISTCEAEVDYISFRLAYYEQPRLHEEFLTAEGYEADFRPISPSRWEWHNPYGGKKERIKGFLRSLRYHADWDPDHARRRRQHLLVDRLSAGAG